MTKIISAITRALKDLDNIVPALATFGAASVILMAAGDKAGWGLLITSVIVSYGFATGDEYFREGRDNG